MKILEKQNIEKLTFPLLCGCFALGIMLSVFVSDNILDNNYASAFTHFVEGLIPTVSIVARCAEVPAIRFMASVISLVTLLLSILLSYYFVRYLFQLQKIIDSSAINKIKVILSMILLFVIGTWHFFIKLPNSPSCPDTSKFHLMLSSKLGMGVFGTVIYLTSWFVLAGTFLSLVIVYKLITYCAINSSCSRRRGK